MKTRPRWSRILAIVGMLAVFVVVAAVIVREVLRDRQQYVRPPVPEGVVAYTDSPIVGTWKEVARIPCEGGREYEPFDPIGQLIISTTGDFSLAKIPLEERVNYLGEFEVDDGTKALRMFDFHGVVPPDIDGEGQYEFDPRTRELVLRDMWLNPLVSEEYRAHSPIACGHRLVPSEDGLAHDSGALQLGKLLEGRKDTSRQTRVDGSFDTMLHCRQLIHGNDHAEYLLRLRRAVGSAEPPEVNFIRLADRSENEVTLTIYRPSEADDWSARCSMSGKHEFLNSSELGGERCSLRLHREGEGESQVWSGTSKAGECKSDREGDAYMIVQMRIENDAVELWERGYDEHGQQTWGSDAAIRYQPATAAWPEPAAAAAPIADVSAASAARLLSYIAGSSSNAEQVDYRDFSPADYKTCPIAISGRPLPAGAKMLLMELAVPPGHYGVEGRNRYSYLFTAYPQGELVKVDVVPIKDRQTCGRGAKIPADKIDWDLACTIVFEAKDDGSYVGNTITDCPSEFPSATRLQIDATVRDGAFDYWPRWYDADGKQVRGMRPGPIQFRRDPETP